MSLDKKEQEFLADASEADMAGLLADMDVYEEWPVHIDEFIDGAPFLRDHFVGVEFLPYWRNVLNRLYPEPLISPYWLVALKGSIGRGKCLPGDCFPLHRAFYKSGKSIGVGYLGSVIFG